jgi:hypothetical protein
MTSPAAVANGVNRADVHGLGAKAFLCFVFRLLVYIIITLFMIRTKVTWGNFRADPAADTALIHLVFAREYWLEEYPSYGLG